MIKEGAGNMTRTETRARETQTEGGGGVEEVDPTSHDVIVEKTVTIVTSSRERGSLAEDTSRDTTEGRRRARGWKMRRGNRRQ